MTSRNIEHTQDFTCVSGDSIWGGGGGGGGNMVDKDSKKGHNTLLCTVGAFATSQL